MPASSFESLFPFFFKIQQVFLQREDYKVTILKKKIYI